MGLYISVPSGHETSLSLSLFICFYLRGSFGIILCNGDVVDTIGADLENLLTIQFVIGFKAHRTK
jgi:hypothetical protein